MRPLDRLPVTSREKSHELVDGEIAGPQYLRHEARSDSLASVHWASLGLRHPHPRPDRSTGANAYDAVRSPVTTRKTEIQ